MLSESKEKQLKILAANIRIDVLKMIEKSGAGHIGGSLSIVELMSVLYGNQLKYDATNPKDETRDMIVLSKGHAGPAWYSALANVQFFDKEVLMTLNQGGTSLPSHPDRNKTPGVDMTTGSLGQGTSAAAGIATGFRLKKSSQRVFLIVGDGELNEGQCWEAFQYIAHNKLNNCIVIIDENKKQLDGLTCDVINPFCLQKKMEAFGFDTQVVKGYDLNGIDEAINNCKDKDSAVCIVLDSIKGQGVPFFEEMDANHSVKFDNEKVINENHKAIATLEAYVKEVA